MKSSIFSGSSADDTTAFLAWMAYCDAAGIPARIIEGDVNLASLTAPIPITMPCALTGRGAGATRIFWNDTEDGRNLFGFPGSLEWFAVSDLSIIGSHETNRSNIIAYPLLVTGTKRFEAKNVEIAYSRIMGMVCRSAEYASAVNCHVHHCARDGINFANCKETLITGNRVNHCDDDAIAVHNQMYSYQRGHVIANNKIRMAQGIKVLGAQVFSITGNVIEFFFGQGIGIASSPIDGTNIEGTSAVIDGVISGNVMSDPIDRAGLDNLNQNSPFIRLSGASAQPGTLSGVPGMNGSSPYAYYKNVASAADNATTTPVPLSGRISISGNIMSRSLPKTGYFSDLGFGKFWMRDGEYDFDLSVAGNTREHGIQFISSPVETINISGNVVNGVHHFILLPASGLFSRLRVSDCQITDAICIMAAPTGSNAYDIAFKDCDFDLDTYHENANRSSDGSFNALGNPTAFLLQGGTGISVDSCRFRNVCRITDIDLGAAISTGKVAFSNNEVWADPVASGFHSGNKGVGYIPASGARIIKANCDLASVDYGKPMHMDHAI